MGSPEPLLNYMVGGTLPKKGVRLLPQGSCWTKPISPSLGRGLGPEGGPRNNGDVDVDIPVPNLLPPSPFSNQKGGKGEARRERVY